MNSYPRKIIGQAKFSYDELNTALIEVEGIVNSRPLTYVTSEDFEESLTPSHLLIGRRILSLPDDLSYLEDSDEEFTVDDETLQRQARHLNNVINHFWKWWNYLNCADTRVLTNSLRQLERVILW